MLVLDTSVAIKWVVEEEGTSAAAALSWRSLIAPDLFQAEVGNVITKKVRRSEMTALQARSGYGVIMSRVSLLPLEPLGVAAFELSLMLPHSIYDCYFLAAARSLGTAMVTADETFVRKARAWDPQAPVHLLGEAIPDE